jgi:hypothetical protein
MGLNPKMFDGNDGRGGNAGFPGDADNRDLKAQDKSKGAGDKPPSPEELAKENERLKAELEKEQKRVTDNRTAFDTVSREKADLKRQLESNNAALLAATGNSPQLKAAQEEGNVNYDVLVATYDKQIEQFKKEGVPYDDIVANKRLALRAQKLEERLERIEEKDRQASQFGTAYGKAPKNFTNEDWNGVTKIQAEKAAAGEKISTETALGYYLGSEDYRKKLIESEVQQRLEAERKGLKAGGHEGGDYHDPTPEELAEKKAHDEYAHNLNNPPGLQIH